MSRTEALFARLDQLERELVSAVLGELRKEAGGIGSRYFTRKREFIADGKKYQDEHTADIERLEKEVMSLRQSLGEPVPGAALAFAHEFPQRLSNTVKPWTGGQVALAREIIGRVERPSALNYD